MFVVYRLCGLQAGDNPDGSRYIKQTGFMPVKGKIGDSDLDTKVSLFDIDFNGFKGGGS